MIPEGNPIFCDPLVYCAHYFLLCPLESNKTTMSNLIYPPKGRKPMEPTVGIELLQKRLAFPQQPNLYLEPKWLRYPSTWARAGPEAEDSDAACYNARPLHIIARSGTRVTSTPRNNTILTGTSLHKVPLIGSNVLDFCVRPALCNVLRRTIHNQTPKLYHGAVSQSPAICPTYPCGNFPDTTKACRFPTMPAPDCHFTTNTN